MGSGAAIRAAGKLTGMGVLNVPPTLQEDKDATADLKEVLDKFCLSSSDSSGSKLAPVSSSAFSAFKLLSESPAVQSVVASLVNDDKVWDSVMENNDIKEFMVSQRNNAAVESASESIARVVFDVPPTLQEAKDATADLKEALDKVYLSSPESSGSKLAPVPPSAFFAFKLLSESPAVQSVVSSLANDDEVWDAVMENNDLKEFMVSQRNNAAIEDQESHRMFDESSNDSSPGGDTADGKDGFFQNVKKSLVDMMNRATALRRLHGHIISSQEERQEKLMELFEKNKQESQRTNDILERKLELQETKIIMMDLNSITDPRKRDFVNQQQLKIMAKHARQQG